MSARNDMMQEKTRIFEMGQKDGKDEVGNEKDKGSWKAKSCDQPPPSAPSAEHKRLEATV
jgi:hypothetical protein